MHVLPFALLLLAQQATQPQATPISRVVISPSTRTVRAGDTVQFSAQAFDASGAAVQNVKIRFGGGGSGAIDTTGMVAASASEMPIGAVATRAGASGRRAHRDAISPSARRARSRFSSLRRSRVGQPSRSNLRLLTSQLSRRRGDPVDASAPACAGRELAHNGGLGVSCDADRQRLDRQSTVKYSGARSLSCTS